MLAPVLPADGSDVYAAIRHQERCISRRPSSIRASQHGCDICWRPPPQGSVPVSMSWAFSPHPPSMTQECAAEAAAAAHTEAAQGVCRGTGKPVDVLGVGSAGFHAGIAALLTLASHIRQ